MNGSIYVLKDDESLVEVREARYDSEALLQQLIAKYPNLLAGDQMNEAEPRRWLLVTREMAVPDSDGSAGRWSLDHLFLDQDATPTLIEVKRSTDTRIRREVVGQMLDYAANAVAYWPAEEIRALFEKTCEKDGVDPEEELQEFLSGTEEIGSFWQRVKTNLSAKKIRMVFVADEIPGELRRIIEFLNEQMEQAEVLGLEIKQFVGEGLKTLVPRVIGQTESAQQKKTPSPGRPVVTEEEFWQVLGEACSGDDIDAVKAVVAWADTRALTKTYRRGESAAVFIPWKKIGEKKVYPFVLNSRGWVLIQMRWIKDIPPFDDESAREQLRSRLAPIRGFKLRDKGMLGLPSFSLTSLTDAQMRKAFLDAIDWLFDQIAATNQSGE